MLKTEKNPFGAGRPRGDIRGKVVRFSVYLVPAQMRQLSTTAAEKGFDSVSQLIAAWADSDCKGAPKHATKKRKSLFG